MRTILRICWTEIYTLFYSPIAWLLLILFIVQTSMAYAGSLEWAMMRLFAGRSIGSSTLSLFAGDGGVIAVLQNNLVFYVPLLSMGVISRELQSGSIALLQSSPIKLGHIVIGKYLAIIAYIFLLTVLVTMLLVFTGQLVENLDYPHVLSGILGVFLLGCTYAAIGLFMSALTVHQVVAALGTFSVLFILSFMGSVGQQLSIVNELTYWLQISGRTDVLRSGLITSSDILYFLAITVLFLKLTHLRLSAGRRIESPLVSAGRHVGVFAITCVFGYLASIPSLVLYHDTTKRQSNTLSEDTQMIVEEIHGPLRITTYVNVLSLNAARFSPNRRNALDSRLYGRLWRFRPELDIDYVYYYGPSNNQDLYEDYPGESDEQIARRLATIYGIDFDDVLSTDEVSQLSNVAAQRYENYYVLEADGESSILRNFNDIRYFPSERELATALKLLTGVGKKVGFVTGHGESSVHGFGDSDFGLLATDRTQRLGMPASGFEVTELRLHNHLPSDLDILVVTVPKTAYSQREVASVSDFMASGGNLLITADGDSLSVLNPLLLELKLGVQLAQGRLVEPKADQPNYVISGRYTEYADDHSFEAPAGFNRDQSIHMNQPAVLRYAGSDAFEQIPIVQADGIGTFLLSAERVPFDDTALALALRRTVDEKEQRIMIVADEEFMSNATVIRNAAVGSLNLEFFSDVLEWLSNGELPVDIARSVATDRNLDLGPNRLGWIKGVLYGVLPISLFLSGAGLLAIRRRR